MVLDGSIVAPYDLNEDESESDDSSQFTLESDEDENDVSNEDDYTSGSINKVGEHAATALSKNVSGESTSSNLESADSDMFNLPLKKILLGKIPTSDGPTNAYTVICGRKLLNGQQGEVYEVNGEQVAVIFDMAGKTMGEVKDEKSAETASRPSLCWIHGY